ncbi:MAG: hypothetical protein JWN44_3753 [Myxococcales bacterium]|nr:hypothetical protein [Myxococcales bacterium]
MNTTPRLALAAALLAAHLVGGCAHTPHTGAQVATATDLKAQLKACHALLDAKKLPEADRCLEPIERGSDDKSARIAAYDRATVFLYQANFKGAIEVFERMLAREHAGGRFDNEAMGHNAIIWVRWAQHDLDGALAENERVRETIEAAKVSDEDRRGVLLHYWWDRAYLYLDDAERKSGDARAASARAADEARSTYEKMARMPDEHDGVAVLAAFFGVRRHDAAAALAAAKQVDPDKDSDLQDLYVLWLAYDAAGDGAGAQAIRKRIEAGYEYGMKVIMLRELAATKSRAP